MRCETKNIQEQQNINDRYEIGKYTIVKNVYFIII